jgi:predicted Zn-dependent protease
MSFFLRRIDHAKTASLLTCFKSFPAHFKTLNILLCAPIIIGLLWLSCESSTFAKDSTADSNAFHRITEAKAAENRGDWTTAIDLLTKITAQSPDNGEFRLMLARACYKTSDFANAIGDLQTRTWPKAADPATLNYAIARCYALQKNADQALFWLKASIALGYRNLEDARADEAFRYAEAKPRISRSARHYRSVQDVA